MLYSTKEIHHHTCIHTAHITPTTTTHQQALRNRLRQVCLGAHQPLGARWHLGAHNHQQVGLAQQGLGAHNHQQVGLALQGLHSHLNLAKCQDRLHPLAKQQHQEAPSLDSLQHLDLVCHLAKQQHQDRVHHLAKQQHLAALDLAKQLRPHPHLVLLQGLETHLQHLPVEVMHLLLRQGREVGLQRLQATLGAGLVHLVAHKVVGLVVRRVVGLVGLVVVVGLAPVRHPTPAATLPCGKRGGDIFAHYSMVVTKNNVQNSSTCKQKLVTIYV